ncbi:MAG: hypothetical protein M3Y59_10355 [Myxococcota bacterium]|nr:hypothetical protein [Myxococcota bacterium]
MARRRTKAEEAAARIRHLLALDATNVMRRLAARKDEMVTLFSRLRDRSPMLEPLASWFSSVQFEALATLDLREQSAVNAFYESLGELRWYLQYTEDMPLTVRKNAGLHLRRLELAYTHLVGALGLPSPEGAPVVDADVVHAEPAEPAALVSGGKPPVR